MGQRNARPGEIFVNTPLTPDPRVGDGKGRAVNVQMPFVR